MAFVVVRVHWLFEPEYIVGFHFTGDLLRLEVSVGAVGVHHELGVGAYGLPDDPHALHVLVDWRATDLHLHSARSEADGGHHLLGQLAQALALFVVATGDVNGHFVGEATEQFIDRQAGDLALEVPERDVYATDYACGYPTPSDQLGLPHVVPNTLGVEGVLSDDDLCEVLQDGRTDLFGPLNSARQTYAGGAFVGLYFDDVQTGSRIHVHSVPYWGRPLPAVGLHCQACDFHIWSSSCRDFAKSAPSVFC